MAVIGIDLGTTNSLVACYKNNNVEIIPNSLGDNLTPSVVSILESGEVVVGKAAKELSVNNPKHSAKEFKRFMGTNKKYYLGDKEFSAIDLSALVLKSLVIDAENYLNEPVEQAVISVPAYFNEQQRKATIQAALIAGIKVKRLINEPTAAATAYHLHKSKNDKTVVIVDLGGGTFDVSILEIFESILEVRAVAGDNYLGGQDFDKALMNYICTKINVPKNSLTTYEKAKLKFLAERCKMQLSDNNTATFNICINDTEHNTIISKDEFNNVIKNIMLKMKLPLKKAIRDAHIKLDYIDEIIMVGGSTKIPAVKNFLATLFARLPLCYLNPDEVIVRGAAILAAMNAHNEELKDIVLTDVCPFTLGIAVAQAITPNEYKTGVFSPIIERNTIVPCSYSHSYVTTRDNQESINVVVYQGESRMVSDNLKLGKISIKVPPLPSGLAEVGVRFTYDINGILEVEVTSTNTGEVKKEILLNKNNLSQQDIEKHLKLIESLKLHPKDQDENLLLIAKGNRYYETTLGELRNQITFEISLFESALESQNRTIIKEAKQRLLEFYEFVEDQY